MTIDQVGGASLVLLGIGAAGLLCLPAIRRSGLGVVHPAAAWLGLHTAFFGLGAVWLAWNGEIATLTAWYVGGAALATGIGVAASDRLAVRRIRTAQSPAPSGAGLGPGTGAAGADPAGADTTGERSDRDPGPVRPAVALLLVLVGLAAVAPSLLASGLPLLAGDPTAARSDLAGLPVQVLRVFLPASAAAAFIIAIRSGERRALLLTGAALAGALAFTVLLASRYLAAELAAVLVVTWLLTGRRLPVRILVAVAALGVVAFGAVQVVRAPEPAQGRELAFAFERTVSRVLLIQPRTLDALQSVIPAEEPYFWGLTWLRRLGPSLGRDDIPNLGYWIYPRLFPDQDPSIIGYAAPGLIGEAWANFGALGLGLFAGLGVALERLGALLCRRRGGTADLAAGAVAIVVLARTHALGLNGSLVLLALIPAWRLLAGGGLAGLWRESRLTLAWRA